MHFLHFFESACVSSLVYVQVKFIIFVLWLELTVESY